MMQGHSLSANLPGETGLGDRFWYWCGASGERYIHTIYQAGLCPPIAGAVFVRVMVREGQRLALAVGRFGPDGSIPLGRSDGEEEIHVHLLARGDAAAEQVRRDLDAAMSPPYKPAARAAAELRGHTKPVQLELLAA